MKQLWQLLLMLVLLLLMPLSYGWNSLGHMVIAQIAYDNLTLHAKQQVNKLTHIVGKYYPYANTFVRSAAWADWIKSDVASYSHWHYVDIPWETGIKPKTHCLPKENIIWATEQSLAVVKNKKANPLQRSLFLRFYIHFVGDLHQPLHTIQHYSAQYPEGDRGGNKVAIRGHQAHNLHALWDSGLGLLHYNRRQGSISHQAYQLSQQIETKYPQATFADQQQEIDPAKWAKESYQIAVKDVYHIVPDTVPSQAYLQKGQTISERQLALAGYRLAYVLNNIFQ